MRTLASRLKNLKDGWWLVITTIVLVSFVVSCLTVNKRAADYWYVRGYLTVSRETLFCVEVDGFYVDVCTEKGEGARIVSSEHFTRQIQRAIRDFRPYLEKYYSNMPLESHGSTNKVMLYFLNQKDWDAFMFTEPRDDDTSRIVGYCIGPKIYLKGNDVSVLVRNNVVRHELFHYLVLYYGLYDRIGNPALVREVYKEMYLEAEEGPGGFSRTEIDAYNFEMFTPEEE